jgi:hypothetical protein
MSFRFGVAVILLREIPVLLNEIHTVQDNIQTFQFVGVEFCLACLMACIGVFPPLAISIIASAIGPHGKGIGYR